MPTTAWSRTSASSWESLGHLAGSTILITGLAGLLAGPVSMALGEWFSVQSARELYARQIAIERDELEAVPEEEAEELALIYQAKGFGRPGTGARRRQPGQIRALDTLAREELGIDPSGVGRLGMGGGGHLVRALLGRGNRSGIAVFLRRRDQCSRRQRDPARVALFLIGAAITVITGRSVLLSGGRQVVFGLAAAAITFGVGRLIGSAVGA